MRAPRDETTGLPIHSLYGDPRKPTPEMLQGVEALVFDIRDIGARQYTYISTLGLAMEAAAERGIPLVVLDRPNPIAGHIVEGTSWTPWDRWLDETEVPGVNPSPNMRSLEAATHYPGMVFVEGTNLSKGRGADLTFHQAGAPWLRAEEVADSMNALGLEGVRYEPVRFSIDPAAANHGGLTVPGVRLVLTDRERFRRLREPYLLYR